jgi:hypothetical protein
MRADPVSTLSAIGSATLPKSVTSPRWRAIRPSSKSVSDATQNSTNAVIRQAAPPANRHATNSGTSTSRSTVSMFATLTRPGVPPGTGPGVPPGTGPGVPPGTGPGVVSGPGPGVPSDMPRGVTLGRCASNGPAGRGARA